MRRLAADGVGEELAEDAELAEGSALFPSIVTKAGVVVVAYERLRDGKRDVVVRRVTSAQK